MKYSFVRYFFAFLILFNSATLSAQPPDAPHSPDLDTLASWMSGYFSSQQQAVQDSAYRDVRLHMVPVWKDRQDGHWFYIEQAMAEHPDKPYRQRVYHLYQADDSVFHSEVFTINDPASHIGAWKTEFPLSDLPPDSLTPREGCTTVIRQSSEKSFSGGTMGKNCRSTLRGAAYATSEVTVMPDRLISWDRGFDTTDKQVWGAEKGGYIFMKMKSY